MKYESFRMWVPGAPVPQGSMRAPRPGVVIHSNKQLRSWRDLIAWTAKDEWRGAPLIDQAVRMNCAFIFEKPKRGRDDWWKDTAPDLDKLIRAVGDALEGVVLKNDARIVVVQAQKKWTGKPPLSRPEPGLFVHIETIGRDWA